VDISWIEKSGGSIYFNENGVVDQNGNTVGEEDQEVIGSADLLSLALTVSEASTIRAFQQGNQTVYSVSLPQETVKRIVFALVPEAAKLSGVTLEKGKMLLTVEDGEVYSLSFQCDGSCNLILFTQPVEVDCGFTFTAASKEILPEAVKNVLAN